jgi:hypothetical protein
VMSEPESELKDSQDTDISSVRSDESLVRDSDGVLIKVKDMVRPAPPRPCAPYLSRDVPLSVLMCQVCDQCAR